MYYYETFQWILTMNANKYWKSEMIIQEFVVGYCFSLAIGMLHIEAC